MEKYRVNTHISIRDTNSTSQPAVSIQPARSNFMAASRLASGMSSSQKLLVV